MIVASTPPALRMLVTTGARRCGTPSKCDSSTFLGSIMMKRTWSGVARSRMELTMLLRQALLPEPVVPAISTWISRVRSASTGLPVMSLPIHMASGEALTGRSP